MDIDIDIYLLNPFKEPGDGSEDLDPVKKGFILAELLKLNNTDAAPKGSGGKSLVLPKYKWPLAIFRIVIINFNIIIIIIHFVSFH